MQEKLVAEQIKQHFKTISLSESWTEKMLSQIDVWEKDQKNSSNNFVEKIDEKLKQVSGKLDKLVDAFLDGMIDKEIYLVKKDELVNQKTSFWQEKKDFRVKSKNWFEPIRKFVKAAHRAEKLALSDDYEEIKSYAEKIGSNIYLHDRKVVFSFKKPFSLIPKYISTTPRRNAAQKNSISPNKSISIDQKSRLSTTFQDAQSSVSTGIAEKPSFSDCGDFSSDFLTKNRFNQHKSLIAIDKKCRLCKKCFAADFGNCDFAFSEEIPESIKWRRERDSNPRYALTRTTA